MLTTKDSWDRSLIQHGILSGSPQVFEVAFAAVRADVLDEEVCVSGDRTTTLFPLASNETEKLNDFLARGAGATKVGPYL